MGEVLAVKAAVARVAGAPFSIEMLTLEQPRANEVLVRIVGAGVCHTDASVRAGDIPLPLPLVLGHEGSGIVEAVGETVEGVGIGDHAVLSFASCGDCHECRTGAPSACGQLPALNFGGCRLDGSHALHAHDGELGDRFFAQSSFASYAIALAQNTVVVPKDIPLELLGPLGCGIQTGAGAALNALQVGTGDSFAVFGSGGVGLSAIMAAKAAGASTIIAVDLVETRLALALELGATHAVHGNGDVVALIHRIAPGGVGYSFDTTGRTEVIEKAIQVLARQGTCALVSIADAATRVNIDANDFISNRKKLIGVLGGNAIPKVFIPKLIAMYRDGKLPLERLVRYYPMHDIETAFADAASGRVIKPILLMDGLR